MWFEVWEIHSNSTLLQCNLIYLLRIYYYETSLLFRSLNLCSWAKENFVQFWLNFLHVNCVKSGSYITSMGLSFIQWVVVLCYLSTKSFQNMMHNDFVLCIIFPICCMVYGKMGFSSLVSFQYSKKKCSDLSHSPLSRISALCILLWYCLLDRGMRSLHIYHICKQLTEWKNVFVFKQYSLPIV